jgi:CRP/FNR family transcriptional regulator, cyclic AMP receptor protein
MIREQKIEAAPLRRNPHLEVLREVAIFKHLDEVSLHELYRRMSIKRWHAGAIVVGQNEPGDSVYVLIHGSARVVLFGETGREMTLSVLRPGDFFGEMSLFDGKPRSANVVAGEDSVFLMLDREAFMHHLAACPRTSLRLLSEMADRLRKANEIINNLALHDVSSRLTRTLLALAEEGGEQRAEGILIRRRPTQQDLANMVGTCRETVSRTLSSMARRGLVVSRGRSILLSRELVDSMSAAA